MPWTKLVSDNNRNSYVDFLGGRVLTYEQAIAEAIDQALMIDPNVIILGEGVDTAGYIYNTTQGLSERYGKNRVFETPIAEAAMTGVALGSAIVGLKPVLIHMRNDFLLVSMDQIINHIAHWNKLFGGDVPLVIRAIVARGWGSGAQHAQSFHGMFAGIDGLDVVMPYTPYDVKGMFLSAVASKRPVLFLEHRWLYKDRGVVPEKPYLLPLHQACVRSHGDDLTIIGMSLTNRDVENALHDLAAYGITADWIDLRSITPLDMPTIWDSVRKTKKLLIVENGPISCGIGSYIASRVYENLWDVLDAPIQQLGWKATTVPSGCKLEEKFYPTIEDLKQLIRKMVNKLGE